MCITEFFGDLILRKEDIKCSQVVVPGDVVSLRFDEPSYVIVVRSGKTFEERGDSVFKLNPGENLFDRLKTK